MALEGENQPKTPETPTVERAPDVPKLPETAKELDDIGSAWETLITDKTAEAKQGADEAFQKAPERIGIEPETATQVAAETGISVERAQAEVMLDVAAETAKIEIATETGGESSEKQEERAELVAALDELKNLDVETLAQEFFENYYKKQRTDPEGAKAYQDKFLEKMQKLSRAATTRAKELRTNPDEQMLAEEAATIKEGAGYTRMGAIENRMVEEGTSFDSKWQAMNRRVDELQTEARKSGR